MKMKTSLSIQVVQHKRHLNMTIHNFKSTQSFKFNLKACFFNNDHSNINNFSL